MINRAATGEGQIRPPFRWRFWQKNTQRGTEPTKEGRGIVQTIRRLLTAGIKLYNRLVAEKVQQTISATGRAIVGQILMIMSGKKVKYDTKKN